MDEPRKGRQTPTQSVVLPYSLTKGQEAINSYNETGRTAQEWQELLLSDILALNNDGLWVHAKFGYSVPRRNGKSEVLMIREVWGLLNEERILHTAHRTTTSHSTWEKLCGLLDDLGVEYKSIKQMGLESIKVEGGGVVNFRTRSSKGGLGEGYDLLVIDEAQEYTDDQETALKYVVTDSKNPQTLFCGTPPTTVSAGTVFLKFRKSLLAGEGIDSGWAEWSVENESDVHDTDLWYETNPSMGTILSERAVRSEISGDIVDFNIQRLGLWLRYNQKSAISKAEWEEMQVDVLPKLKGKLYVGIKYGIDGTHVAMSVACKTAKGKIFVEVIDCMEKRAGNLWIITFLKNADVGGVAVDGASGQQLLAKEMKDYKLKTPKLPTVKEVIVANTMFEESIFKQNLVHMGQPSLTQTISNCEKRAIGSNGGFGYKSLRDDIDISLLDSMIFAHWLCAESKERKKQKINY
ncbi:MAG: terminase large subunit [Anaerostipes sp.]|nr:terminase large subunit [Anaerostipes sp.]